MATIDLVDCQRSMSHLLAVQRAGMMTTSLSEARFRSDVWLLIGGDSLFDDYPRLLELLLKRNLSGDFEPPRRVVAIGSWSADAMNHIRSLAEDAIAIECPVESIPQSLFQWSNVNAEALSTSLNPASRWLTEATYLTLVWSPASLSLPQLDCGQKG